MCHTLGMANGWWSVAGLIIELAGFVFLWRLTIHDLSWRFAESIFAQTLERPQNQAELVSNARLWDVIQRGGRVKLYVGGGIILASFVLQIVGSWPC